MELTEAGRTGTANDVITISATDVTNITYVGNGCWHVFHFDGTVHVAHMIVLDEDVVKILMDELTVRE